MLVRLLRNVSGVAGKVGDVVDVEPRIVGESPSYFRDIALEAAEAIPEPVLTKQEEYAVRMESLRVEEERRRALLLEQARQRKEHADAEFERLKKLTAEYDERDRQAREQSGVIMLADRKAKLEAAKAAAEAQLAAEKPAAEVFADAQEKAAAAEAPHKRRKQG